jgi:hypothetical protein
MSSDNDTDNDDLLLVCKDCGNDFTFTAGERRFFTERSLTLPKRCPACRAYRRQEREAGTLRPAERIER